MDRSSPIAAEAPDHNHPTVLPQVIVVVRAREEVEKLQHPYLAGFNSLLQECILDHGEQYVTLPYQLEQAVRNPEVFVDIMGDHREISRLLELPERWAGLLSKMSIKLIEARRLITHRRDRSERGLLPEHLDEDTNAFCTRRMDALVKGCEKAAEMIVSIAQSAFTDDDDVYWHFHDQVTVELDRMLLIADQAPSEAAVTRRIARTGSFERRLIVEAPPEQDDTARRLLKATAAEVGDVLDDMFGEAPEEQPSDPEQPSALEEQPITVEEGQEGFREQLIDVICYFTISASLTTLLLVLFKKLSS